MATARPRICSAGLLLFAALVGCRTAPPAVKGPDRRQIVHLSGKTDTSEPVTVSPSAAGSQGGTLLAVPTRDQLKKNSLDPSVLHLLENGSPASIRKAVDAINADPRGMTEQNRIALAVSGEMMKILYPFETVDWPLPSVPESGAYIGAISSARMGVYDYNTGGSDFMSLVLPSLVLVLSDTPGNWYEDAGASLRKAATINPDSVLPPWFLALLAERQGRPDAADSLYEKAWKLDSSCYPAGIALARSLIRRGNGSAALEVSQNLSSRYPGNRLLTGLCADAAFVMRDWNTADSYVMTVLKSEPDNARFLLMRARILVERKDYFKASTLLDAFANTSRSDKNYLLLHSRVVREWNKNLVSAISILQDAQRLYPDDTDVLLASAEVCYQSGQTINGLSGRDFVKRVLDQDAGNRTALGLLVSDYVALASWPEALAAGESLLARYPADDTRILMLRACLGAGETDRALVLARGLYATNQSDEVTALYLQALTAAGDGGTAGTLIAARLGAAQPFLKSILYYYSSRLQGDPESRLSALRSSLLADPRNRDSLFAMYEWYLERKDYRKAQYYLKQVIALDPQNRNYGKLLASLEDLLAR